MKPHLLPMQRGVGSQIPLLLIAFAVILHASAARVVAQDDRGEAALRRCLQKGDSPGAAKPSERRGKIADKVDSLMLQARDQISTLQSEKGTTGDPADLRVDSVLRVSGQDEIQCYVVMKQLDDDSVLALEKCGLRVELVSSRMGVVQGWIPVNQIEAIATLPVVRRIKLPDYGVRNCEGQFCTEGDSLHRAQQVRALGIDGSGVKVGVISDGVDHFFEARASGDLSASITIHPTQGGGGDEGTAMLEIIHDIAPGANMYFAGGLGAAPTSVEMIEAIDWLVQQGVDVIVDDIVYFNEPFFEDGPVAEVISGAVASGIVYCTSAGNFGDNQHYQGFFNDAYAAGTLRLHDFDPGPDIQDNLPILLYPGESVRVFLQWNDAFGASTNDYDLWLFDPVYGDIAFGGHDSQDGDDEPYERAVFTNFRYVPLVVMVAIENYGGNAAPRVLELFTTLETNSAFASSVDSIVGHAAVSGVISCAATNAADYGEIAAYSSRGPSTFFFPEQETRQTPFCTATAGVVVSGVGGFSSPFYGTSAAAPHAAGLAALLLDATNRAATPAQIMEAFAQGTDDLGDSGFDYDSGHGVLNAMRALEYFAPSPPAGISASRSAFCDKIKIEWTGDPFAEEYSVWRSNLNQFSYAAEIGRTANNTFVDDTVTPEHSYYYWIGTEGWFVSSKSGPVEGIAGVPGIPMSITATKGTFENAISITWEEVEGAESYRIWRTMETDEESAVVVGEVAAPPLVDDSVEPLIAYYYLVTAKNACGETPFLSVDYGYYEPTSAAGAAQPAACGAGGCGGAMPLAVMVIASACTIGHSRKSKRKRRHLQ